MQVQGGCQGEWELEAAKAQVARYKAEVKVRAEVGELIGGSNASLDTEVVVVGGGNQGE